ncbi:replication protein, partial [Staphylococcus aureus]|uniref:protein rep n=1 Tax=Staphylococcus aureus TaxID=1280 RepID=UPI00065B599C
CVETAYFKKKENYITPEVRGNLWKRALQVHYRPAANVKAYKPNRKGVKDIESAIKATSKYTDKSSDFLTDDDEKNQE